MFTLIFDTYSGLCNQMYDIQTKNYKRQKKLGFVKLAFGVLIGLFIAK